MLFLEIFDWQDYFWLVWVSFAVLMVKICENQTTSRWLVLFAVLMVEMSEKQILFMSALKCHPAGIFGATALLPYCTKKAPLCEAYWYALSRAESEDEYPHSAETVIPPGIRLSVFDHDQVPGA